MTASLIQLILLSTMLLIVIVIGVVYLVLTAKARKERIELMEICDKELLDAWDSVVRGIIEMESLLKKSFNK